MDRFDFRKQAVELDIAGHAFTIRSGDMEALDAANVLLEKLKAVDLGTLDTSTYRSLCDEIMTAIDSMLGEDACARVLAGRRVNIIDLVDLLVFVLKAVTGSFRNEANGIVADLTATVAED